MPAVVRLALTVAATLAGCLVLARAWVAVAGAGDVNLVSGVWLALAADTREGIFYRPLAEAGFYGGTRYFPLLFVLIAAAARAGLAPIPAGQLVGIGSGIVLLTGAWALLARLGVERRLAASGAILAVAPYFVLQSIFAIRAEPLAAGLVCWGASFVAARIHTGAAASWASVAAVCFTLAAAGKPTTLYAPLAALAALGWAGRRDDAVRLGLLTAVGCLLLAAAIGVTSEGRAFASFRAGALGGGSVSSMLGALARLDALWLAMTSRYLTAVLVLVGVTAVLPRFRLLALPALLMALAALASAIALATPGTILANQAIEPYVAAAVLLTWRAGQQTRLRSAACVVICMLLAWTAVQNSRELRAIVTSAQHAAAPAERAALQRRVSQCAGTWVAESPLLPILAGQRPVLLDPFAFRVAAAQQPHLAEELAARLRSREFGCVVLEMDPGSPTGEAWYRNVHLGTTVIDALGDGYAYQESIAGHRFYVPLAAEASIALAP